MELNLDGKTVLITGGSHGIGKAIKETLKDEGANVYDFSRTTSVDLMSDEGLEYALSYVDSFDILINNLGGGGTWDYPFWRIVMEKNFGVTSQLMHKYLDKKRKWGRIINIVSTHGKEKGHNPIFTASKSAIIAYTKTLSDRYKNTGITLNCVAPGHIDVGKDFPDKPKVIGQPSDVANIVTFLCSDKAKHINGSCITVDGGASHSF